MINLLRVNRYVTLTKFKMETVCSLLVSIGKGDLMFSIVQSPVLAFLQLSRVFAQVSEWAHKRGI